MSVPEPGAMRVLERSPDGAALAVEFRDMPEAMVAALRQTIMSDVPSAALHWVTVAENSGGVSDQQLSFVLGTVDLRVDPAKMEPLAPSYALHFLKDNTRVRQLPVLGAAEQRCILAFRLEVQCHWDAVARCVANQTVTAGDLVWQPFGDQLQHFGAEGVRVADPEQVITRLFPGQRIELEAWAVLGTGHTHIKFSPVSTCYFNLKAEVRLQPAPEVDDIESLDRALIDVCPRGVFGRDARTGALAVLDESRCDFCDACMQSPQHAKRVHVRPRANHYWLHINGKGRLPAAQILLKATELLSARTRQLAAESELD